MGAVVCIMLNNHCMYAKTVAKAYIRKESSCLIA